MEGDLIPEKAAFLAQRIYMINASQPLELAIFLNNPLFSGAAGQKKQLSAQVGGRLFRAAEDAFGLCAKGAGAYENDLFLIFRGTTTANNKADFITDARIGLARAKTGMPVHTGFNHTFNSMLPENREFIVKNNVTGRVHCIGHSLGGAVANLAADWVATAMRLPVSLYTFGQPRVGLISFSTMATRRIGRTRIHRVYHTTDPVPMVPVFPYVHNPLPGHGCRVLSSNPIHSAEAHAMAGYGTSVARCSGWKDLERAPPLQNHEDAIKGWLTSNANSNPGCPKTFEWLEKALIWLISKAASRAVYAAQLALMGVHTFVDTAAYIIAKGIELGKEVGRYAKLFFKKAMAILGMKFKEGVTKLTRAFIRYVLLSIIQRVNQMAQNAIRHIGH